MKRLIVSIAATLALAAVAMPTNDEVKKAVPTVKELMNPLVAEFRSRKKSAVEVGETAMAYAKEADTEGAKFLLLKGAVWYFAQAKDDAKAVAAIAALGEQVKDLPPEVLRNDILKPAIDHVSEQNVPGLFAQFRSASAQMEIAKLASSIRRNRADEPTRRRYAELLVVTGDWKAALDIFAKLDDAKVVQAAKDEIGGTTLAPAGDFWWNYTPTEATAADAIKAHAVALYRKAIAAGELTGLKKVVAEKRIASVPFADIFTVSGVGGAGRATPTATSSKELPVATSKRPDQLTLDLGGGVKMEMVGCPSGQFTKIVKQVPANQRWRGAKTVEVTRPFWIGKYPVTIGEWERLMPKVKPLPGVKAKDMDPKVPVQILRNDCMGDVSRKTMEEFMDKLTRKFKRQLPPGYIFRLPTDAEWVFAIRANASDPNDPFCSGEPPKDRVLESYVLYEDSEQYWLERGCDPSLFNKKDLLAPYIPVGQRKPNAWGIYDMGGCTPECMLDLGEGNPFADDLKDPLVLNDDPSKPQSARLRYGFKTKKEVVGSEGNFLTRGGAFGGGPISWRGAWNVQYNLRFGSATRAVKLRLVVGPDLLKERGITPPPPDSK